jgi:hypothetical protein
MDTTSMRWQAGTPACTAMLGCPQSNAGRRSPRVAAALYRVNFLFRGSGRSMLKLLSDPPFVGQRLSLENIELVVTAVAPEPAATGIAATVQAAVDEPVADGTDPHA